MFKGGLSPPPPTNEEPQITWKEKGRKGRGGSVWSRTTFHARKASKFNLGHSADGRKIKNIGAE